MWGGLIGRTAQEITFAVGERPRLFLYLGKFLENQRRGDGGDAAPKSEHKRWRDARDANRDRSAFKCVRGESLGGGWT